MSSHTLQIRTSAIRRKSQWRSTRILFVDLSDQGTQSSILFVGQVRYFLPPTSSNVEPLELKSSTQRSE